MPVAYYLNLIKANLLRIVCITAAGTILVYLCYANLLPEYYIAKVEVWIAGYNPVPTSMKNDLKAFLLSEDTVAAVKKNLGSEFADTGDTVKDRIKLEFVEKNNNRLCYISFEAGERTAASQGAKAVYDRFELIVKQQLFNNCVIVSNKDFFAENGKLPAKYALTLGAVLSCALAFFLVLFKDLRSGADPGIPPRKPPRVYWIDLFRFDTRVDKSTYIEMCNELTDMGCSVVYLTSYYAEKIIPKSARFTMHYIYSPKIPVLFRLILIFRIALFLIGRIQKTDLIINQPNGMLFAVLAFFKPCGLHLDIRTLPVGIRTAKNKLDRLLYWKLSIRLFHGRYNSFSFITSSLKKAVEDEFKLNFPDYAIWSSGVNTKMFYIDRAQYYTQSTVRLLYHGQIAVERGLLELLKAIKMIVVSGRADIKLTLAGSGPDIDILKKYAEENGIAGRVHFTGLLPYEQMPACINAADIGVCPLPDNPGWNVSSPLKVFEYLACGKPVICTPIPAHTDILSDLDGVIIAGGEDDKALAAAIIKAYAQLETLKKQAPALREFVEMKYTWKIQAANLTGYLRTKGLL